jgi:hypothetical protein
VLAISRYFPPLGSAGSSIRLVKFIKYATKLGWSFTVITQDQFRPVVPEGMLSEFLLKEIPSETSIIRIANPLFGQTFLKKIGRRIVGQSSLPWGLSAIWNSWIKLNPSKPDVIFVNSPPFTNAAIGYELALLLKVPLVLDMKDDWIDSSRYQEKGNLRRAIERWIERNVVNKANKVTIVTEQSYKSFVHRYSSLNQANKFVFVPNGEDIEEFSTIINRKQKKVSERFRLQTSAAGFRPDYRDLTPLLKSLEQFLSQYPDANNHLEIEFIGEDIDIRYKVWLERLLPTNQIFYTKLLDRQRLVERLWMADLFFLVQPINNRTAISSTLYEYWATGKAPVLLFSEIGASSDLIIKNQLGEHCTFDQIDKASNYIEEVYRAYNSSQPIWIERSGVEKYDRKELTNQMISVWSEAMTRRGE